jgi:DNA-binding beta-propeller fold protein YncE
MVTVLEKATGKVLARVRVDIEPEGLAVSKDGKTVVDVSESTSMAHFIDTQSWKMVANVLVDTRPRVVECIPDQGQFGSHRPAASMMETVPPTSAKSSIP